MGSLFFLSELERVEKYGENSKVFVSASALFDTHKFLEREHVVFVFIEHTTAGEVDEFVVTPAFIDGSKDVKMASLRAPERMPNSLEVNSLGCDMSRVMTIHSVQFIQRIDQACNIVGRALVNDIDVHGDDGCPPSHSTQSSYKDELDFMLTEHTQNGEEICRVI